MRIVYVTARLPHGSDEAFVAPEIRQLVHDGHEVSIVPRSPRGEIVHGSDLLAFARRVSLFSPEVLWSAALTVLQSPLRSMRAVWPLFSSRSFLIFVKNLAVIPKAMWLARFAQNWHAGHIHCHWAGTTATMSMVASAVSGIPWSLTAHRWDIVENNLLAIKTRSAALARFISGDGLRMARKLGVPAVEHVRLVRMGVTVPAFAAPRKDAAFVLCPARLVEVKGHSFLLRAWQLLKQRGVTADLWLAGQGELMSALQRMSDDLGLRESVRFLGAVPHRELLELYRSGSVSAVVVASVDLGNGHHEGIPVALMEAMSFGVPVVATAAGGTGELVDGVGLLVPPSDPEALAAAIQLLMNNPNLRGELGLLGRLRVTEEYNIEKIAKDLVDAFETASRRTSAQMPCART